MNGAQKIGAIYRITTQLTPLILFLSLVLNVVLVLFLGQKPQIVASNVIAYDPLAQIENGVPLRLECDNDSKARKRLAIATALKLMKIFYEYEKGKKEAYVAKYKNFFPYIVSGSQAERVIRSTTEKRVRDLMTDWSSFSVNYQKTRVAAVDGIMYVAVTGTRQIKTPKGLANPEIIKLNVDMKIGEDNASYMVTRVSEH